MRGGKGFIEQIRNAVQDSKVAVFLMSAQEALPTNSEKDAFGADYRVLNRAWEALSPDLFLGLY